MTEQNKQRVGGKRHAGLGGSTKEEPVHRVMPEKREEEPERRKSPKVRVAGQGERLTPEERKRRFANNLDMLVRLVGLSRKGTADEIGIAHKLVLRLVSAGISRRHERNFESLTKIAAYFALTSVDDLWRADLLQLVLPADGGRGFVEKFRDRLLAERQRRLAVERVPGHDELALLSRALGYEVITPTLTGDLAEKIAAILASPKAEQFRRVIDDYHELAIRPPLA